MRKQKKEDERIVKVRYINHEEGPLGRLTKPYAKYAGDPIQRWHFIHGYEYDVPYGLVAEVNEVSVPVRSGLQMVDGKDVSGGKPLEKDDTKKVHEFVSTKF